MLVDATALRDGRGAAGIGRYVAGLLAGLEALPDGPEVEVVRPPGRARSENRGWRWLAGQPWALGAAASHRPAAVHGPAGEPVLGWPRRRQVVTIHDVVPWTTAAAAPSGRRLAAFLEVQRRLLRGCGALIAVSGTVAGEAAAALGIPAERFTVVAEGVDAPFESDPAAGDAGLRAGCGAPAGGYVLWAGSMRSPDPRKALDVLVEAMAALEAEGRGVPLVLAGAPGAASEQVSALARERGVRLHLPGFVSDPALAALYRGAAAAVLPSRHEGFGLPALEAMACGAPLVAGRAGNLPDLCGDAALLVPPGDARELAGALGAVLGDTAVAARLRVAGPRRAAAFSWRRCAEETAAVYRTLYSRP
ncbi:MAG TPA: glycosyltransferase family 1 protein [Candidatus Dormibacteraeota bacterium]